MNDDQRKRFGPALERLAGDEAMLRTVAEIASEDGPDLLSKLTAEVDAGDSAEAARTAHTLKGLLSGFEPGEPTSRLQPLIVAARAGQVAEVRSLHAALKPRLESLLDEIRGLGGDSTP